MLHELLKIVTYLSILTSSTSYSSHLSRESYLNNQRASPYSSFPNEQLTDDYVPNVDGEEVDRWIGYENSMDPRGSSSSDYLIPRHFNVNENPLGIGSGGNNRFSSRKPQSYKKSAAKNSRFNSMKMQQNSRSQSQEPYTLRKKSTAKLGLSNSQTSNKNATENIQSFEKKMNKTTISPSNLSSYNSNEYPNSQQSTISLSKDQELQQLFGVENAQIYKKHQKQLKSSSDDVNLPQLKNSNDATDIKDSQKKRNNGENEQLPEMSSFTSNHLMRATRRQREYDVPLIRKFIPK